jgi:hypothetical protein
VIQPGESVKLEGQMTPKPGLGPKTEKISVFADGYDGYSIVYIRAEVALAVRAIPGFLDARGGNSGEFRLVAQDGKPFRVIRANGRPPVFRGAEAAGAAPRVEHTLAFDLSGYTRETIPWYWVIETDHPEVPVLDMRVWHEWTKNPKVTPRWNRGDDRILGGVLRQGDTIEFDTKLKYNSRGTPDPGIPQVTVATRGIRAEVLSAVPKANELNLKMRVTVLAAGPGLLYEKIVLTHGGYSDWIMFFAQLAEGGSPVEAAAAPAAASAQPAPPVSMAAASAEGRPHPAVIAGGAVGLALATLAGVWLVRRKLDAGAPP